jgi:multiple sugar transport system ATP-binding protein
VYDNPANMFVAGFIGIPTMNFIPVTVQGRTAKASGFEIELARAPGVEKGMLGIRPEAMTEHPHAEHPGLDLKVEVSEILGPDQFLYGKVGGDAITARVDPQLKVDPGDRVKLGVDTRRLHLFEPVTGVAIL